jgi:hypothetical protein
VLYRSVFDVVRDFLHDEALSAEDKVLSKYPDRHGFWGSEHRYPPRDAEINRFCNQHSW